MTYRTETQIWYVTEDGRKFHTAEEAKAHSIFIYLKEFLAYSTASTVAEAINSNVEAVREAIRLYEVESSAPIIKPTAPAINDGWIEWNSDELPVEGDTRVDVKFCDGRIHCNRAAKHWYWGNDFEEVGSVYIVAYRIHNGEKA